MTRGQAGAPGSRVRVSIWAPIVALAPLALTACVEDGPMALAPAADAPAAIAPRPGVSPRGAPVALINLEGGPAGVAPRFSGAFAAAAARREVVATDPGSATYFARGFLTAEPVDGGARFASVWDLYDHDRRRVRRIESAIVTPGSAPNPWSLADDRAISALADASAAQVAATLTYTPEAVAAAAITPRGGAVVVATDPDAAPASAAPPAANAFR